LPTPLVTFVSRFAPYGDFQKARNADAIADVIANRLTIIRGTYVQDPELGTEIHKYVFEHTLEDLKDLLTDEVRRTLHDIEHTEIVDVVVDFSRDYHSAIIYVIVQIEEEYMKKITLHVTKDYISLLDVGEA